MTITVQAAPEELGFDPRRLAEMDTFLHRYVDAGLLPGWQVVVSRDGQVVHASTAGYRDVDERIPVEDDTRWRLFSMTKPIASIALMMLWERGAFQLNDPIAKHLPEFAEPRVYVAGPPENPATVAATEPIRFWHLLTHTSGLTYGFHRVHPVDALYRAKGFLLGAPEGMTLEQACQQWAKLPLLFEPGSEWTYSVATDVVGRLVEVLSGESFDEFLRDELFTLLGMTATAFHTEDERLARCYSVDPVTRKIRPEALLEPTGMKPPSMFSGGGGLVSTAEDYWRFAEMLRGRGEFDGARVLGSRTVDMIMSNHLPGNADLDTYGRPVFAETPLRGMGFGLGGSVVIDPIAVGNLCSVGEFSWGGAASTAFWVDPVERITVQFFTQLFPSNALPIRAYLRTFVNSALVD